MQVKSVTKTDFIPQAILHLFHELAVLELELKKCIELFYKDSGQQVGLFYRSLPSAQALYLINKPQTLSHIKTSGIT